MFIYLNNDSNHVYSEILEFKLRNCKVIFGSPESFSRVKAGQDGIILFKMSSPDDYEFDWNTWDINKLRESFAPHLELLSPARIEYAKAIIKGEHPEDQPYNHKSEVAKNINYYSVSDYSRHYYPMFQNTSDKTLKLTMTLDLYNLRIRHEPQDN